MVRKTLTRKTRFRLALVEAGVSLSEWARNNDVSRTHLYLVLDGERAPSTELQEKIEAVLSERAA